MKIIIKITVYIFLGIIIFSAISFFTDHSKFGKWQVINTSHIEIPWAPFFWGGDTLGYKYYEKVAMQIPVRIEGIPNNFLFQFDLGADITMLYEKNIRSFFVKRPELNNKISRLKSIIQFWNLQKGFKDIGISFGRITAKNKFCYIKRNYGQEFTEQDLNDKTPLHLGTIGADLFQNKILIIDYPNQRFAICNTMPQSYSTTFIDIDLDNAGRVILPMNFKGKAYRILFDNGSSIFPLLVQNSRIDSFSTSKTMDTIKGVAAWGSIHNVFGRLMKDSFQLAGQIFSNITIYEDFAKTNNYDAIAGNALFWDRIVIIDFKNEKFGIK